MHIFILNCVVFILTKYALIYVIFLLVAHRGFIITFLYILILYLGEVCPHHLSSSCPGPIQKPALFYLLFKYVRYINHIQPPLSLPFILPPPTNTYLLPGPILQPYPSFLIPYSFFKGIF
jgi:hypothetical protein